MLGLRLLLLLLVGPENVVVAPRCILRKKRHNMLHEIFYFYFILEIFWLQFVIITNLSLACILITDRFFWL